MASEGLLDIIDSRILKFPSINCAKVSCRGLRCFPSGSNIRWEGDSGLPSDRVEPFEELETIVVVAYSVDWSNYVYVYDGAAAFQSQNSASILASLSSSLKGGSGEGCKTSVKGETTGETGEVMETVEGGYYRRVAISRHKIIFCPTTSFMSAKSCLVSPVRTDSEVMWCSAKTSMRLSRRLCSWQN